tara:strand:+ start:142 stop:390 length:249 start_codon:yes stop_codon:yes gene_type:complete
MIQTNKVNMAKPSQLKIDGKLFLDLPYDKEIYCEQGKFTLTKKKHAEDIGVYRFIVKFDYGRCDSDYRYNPDGDYWINVWEI